MEGPPEWHARSDPAGVRPRARMGKRGFAEKAGLEGTGSSGAAVGMRG